MFKLVLILPTHIVHWQLHITMATKSMRLQCASYIRRLHAHNTPGVFDEVAAAYCRWDRDSAIVLIFNVTLSLEKVRHTI